MFHCYLIFCVTSALIAWDHAEARNAALADLGVRVNANGGQSLNISSQGYAGNATLWTPVTQTWPSLLLQPASVGDVVDCVQTLQQARLPFRVRGSGHSYAGYSSHTGPVIDTRLLAAVQVSECIECMSLYMTCLEYAAPLVPIPVGFSSRGGDTWRWDIVGRSL